LPYSEALLIISEMKQRNTWQFEFPLRLKDPGSYYHGIVSPQRPRSNNLICFLRNSRQSLQQKHFANRSHHRHVLILVLETAGSIIVDGAEHKLLPEQAYYVKPFQFHHYMNLDQDDLRWLFFTFDLDDGSDSLASLSHHALELNEEDIRLCHSITTCSRRRSKNDQSESLPRLDTLLHRLAHRQKKSNQQTSQHSWIAEAEALIIQSVESNWTVEAIAQKLGVSGRHLRSLFEAEMGVNIREYRANYQLHRVLSLMHEPKLQLGQIASLAGFNSQAAFNRFIKRHTSKTPKALRHSLTLYK
jgi:AraC-like DNA-binding protein